MSTSEVGGQEKREFFTGSNCIVIETLLAPSHQWRAVSDARVSPELRPGFLAVGASRVLLSLEMGFLAVGASQGLLSLEMGFPAHLVAQIAVALQSTPELEKGVPGGDCSHGEKYGEGILHDVD